MTFTEAVASLLVIAIIVAMVFYRLGYQIGRMHEAVKWNDGVINEIKKWEVELKR